MGDLVVIEAKNDEIVLKPLFKRRKNVVDEMLSLAEKPLDDDVKLVEETWNEA